MKTEKEKKKQTDGHLIIYHLATIFLFFFFLKAIKKIALKIKSSAREIKTRENKKNIYPNHSSAQAHVHTQTQYEKANQKK